VERQKEQDASKAQPEMDKGSVTVEGEDNDDLVVVHDSQYDT